MNKKKPIIILECANSHDGNYKILNHTIQKFCRLDYEKIHIKFQPFSANTIAVPNYDWFSVYKELELTKLQWKMIINKANQLYKGVWLDIFDEFSIEILKKNINKIYGIKIQSSTLENEKIIYLLNKINFKKKIILNISGKTIFQIKKIIESFKKISKKIILQSGYQDYPTNIKETNFKKVITLQKNFPNYIYGYADHLDSSDIKSIFTPIKAYQNNCEIIEKHISLRGKKSKYDYFSSLNFEQTKKMFDVVNFYFQKDSANFISNKEKKYLNKTVQIPIATKYINKGNFINYEDISYLRSNHKNKKIYKMDLNKKYFALRNIKSFDPLNSFNSDKIKIGIFIACRLKSSRLKKKAILKLSRNQTLIDKCILSAKKIKNVDVIAITTSTDKEDKILEKYCNKHSIKFFQGSKDNVIKRYIDAAKKFKVNTIIRITGDCPEISNEITNILLNKHLKTNSDYTVAKNSPIGFSGEILNLSSLKKIIKKKPRAYLSEYMTYYFTNNSKIFKLNFVNLPKYMQKKYRMTIDYKKDLIFFKELYKCFEKEKIEFNFKNLNLIIKKYKYLNNINSNLKLTYKTDKKLIDKINKETIIFEK